ncbi:unnamed protein product, partial [Rotaria sordida]
MWMRISIFAIDLCKAKKNNICIIFYLIADIPLQWINCNTWIDQLSIEKVEANIWPPKRNELFIYGNYNKTIVYREYSLSSIFGPLVDLGIKLPTYSGPLKMIIFNGTIPEIAPE